MERDDGGGGITAKSVQILGGTRRWVGYGFPFGSFGRRVDEKRRRVASLGRRRKPRKLCDETAAGFSGIARLRALETRRGSITAGK